MSFTTSFFFPEDGPADCLADSVTCAAIPNTVDVSVTDIMVHLWSSDNLMCVEAYEFVFNGEIKRAPANSPSVVFNVSRDQRQTFPNQTIYTLDFENRRGQVPCIFSIMGEGSWKFTL